MPAPPARIALVGTYPPTQCGIATFTRSLREALTSESDVAPVAVGVVRLLDEPSTVVDCDVAAEWIRGESDPVALATELSTAYDCAIVQHEFGIFGGTDGEEVVAFVDALRIPVIVVLHTVLSAPGSNQRRIVERLAAAGSLLVVQTEAAKRRLLGNHRVTPAQTVVIPHGAAPNVDGRTLQLAERGELVMLTWGLVGPGKGIEHVIAAIAELSTRAVPTPTYLVAGQTHPAVLRSQGERYREELIELAARLGVADRIRFDATYRDFPELRAIVRSADIVVLPYDSTEQVTSGVLVEALASGRPVVATAFPHAVEALAGGVGAVVPHRDPIALADALEPLIADPELRDRMAARARIAAEPTLWPEVAARYRELVRRLVEALAAA